MTDNVQVNQRAQIDAKLESKYQEQLQALAPLNFKDMMQMHEKAFPFSAIALFFLYPMMLMNGEVFRVESPLRFVILYPVLVNRQYGTFAAVFSKGVTFSTAYTDGTVLSSTSFPSQEVVKPEHKIYRFAPTEALSIVDTWTLHQERYQELAAEGLETTSDFSLENFERIVHRIDTALRFKR
jgi:hypothetical protein